MHVESCMLSQLSAMLKQNDEKIKMVICEEGRLSLKQCKRKGESLVLEATRFQVKSEANSAFSKELRRDG